MNTLCPALTLLAILLPYCNAAEAQTMGVAGTATVDITPTEPIRLNGFGGRRQETADIRQRLFARALAFGNAPENTAIVVTVDTLGIPDEFAERVWQKIHSQIGIKRESLAFCATHTHSGPMILGCANTLFGEPVPVDQWNRIVSYTHFLEERLAEVAVSAFRNQQPAKLSRGTGSVSFAENRRTPRGPVDHRLPVLAVHSTEGTLRAVLVSYACHCVTLSDNFVSGDWAGYAAEHLQRMYPDCQPLIAIGCGADANPRGGVQGNRTDAADSLGLELAQAVQATIKKGLQPLPANCTPALQRITLPLAPLPDQSEWEKRAAASNAIGYHAKVQLQRLNAGQKLTSEIAVPIQTMKFNEQFSMIFLPGEVVADYSLRLSRELPNTSLWIAAYSNACPGYVPSERVLQEGGYEGGGAMVYYDIPGPWAPGLEEAIVTATGKLVAGPSFSPNSKSHNASRTNGTIPLEPAQELLSLRTAPGLTAELVASEPLVQSPVAITFGPDGSVWTAEMRDYPQGGPGPESSGTIRRLTDTNGDGTLDQSQVFLDGLPFPTGVTIWRDGLLICAAPDILLARDLDHDGRADEVKKLWSGFATHNYQARVNSLEYGLDGWVHGSCGLFGGSITCQLTGKTVELGQRDFRCNPDTGELEPASGSTQQGRVRNDYGDWFGCDNTEPLLHYPLQDHYLRRNPAVAAQRTVVSLLAEPQPGRLYPVSTQTLFALSGPPGKATAACGLGICRDSLEGDAHFGCTLTCEPVNNLVYRQILTQSGSTFRSHRPDAERQQEYLASSDPWFRPVQARTGPDGAIWIVDMYRFIIEHPIWIPPATLAELDTRAGADRGRIYRIRPQHATLRPVQNLSKMQGAELADSMNTPNGTVRDLVQQLILWNADLKAVPVLQKLLQSQLPEVRLQAASTLACLRQLDESTAIKLLQDENAQVRRHALRLCEQWLPSGNATASAVTALRKDHADVVRMQLACTAGMLPANQAGPVLADLLSDPNSDAFLLTAARSSLTPDNILQVLQALDEHGKSTRGQLLQQAVTTTSDDVATQLLNETLVDAHNAPSPTTMLNAASAIRGWLQRKQQLPPKNLTAIQQLLHKLKQSVLLEHTSTEDQIVAARLLGTVAAFDSSAEQMLLQMLTPQTPLPLQRTAAEELLTSSRPELAQMLLSKWDSMSPEIRTSLLAGFLQRNEWILSLLDAVKEKQINPGELNIQQKQLLLNHTSESIRQAASPLLKMPSEESRTKLIQKFAAAMTSPGDSVAGAAVFRKHCSNCHRIRDVGSEVGPDISTWGSRPVDAILQAVLDPNLAVDPRYQGYAVLLNDGRSLNGLIRDESDNSFSLLASEGKTSLLLRSDVEVIRSTGKSLMPEGLEQNLTPADLGHLYAWLSTLKTPPRSFPGNQPQIVSINPTGNSVLLASTAEFYGEEIVFEQPFQNAGFWHGPTDHLRWQLQNTNAQEFTLWAEWACHPDSAGNPFRIETTANTLRGKVQSTGGWDRYQLQRIGPVLIPMGISELVIRPESDPHHALADLRAIHLVAGDGVPLARGMTTTKTPLPETPKELASWLLNDSLPADDREAAIAAALPRAEQILPLLIAGLPDDAGSAEEYRRIPWIWRLSVATAKSGNKSQIQSLLLLAVPAPDSPLQHWQAVVIGGGLINGATQSGLWPHELFAASQFNTPETLNRWNRTLQLAKTMALDKQVPAGTRYDALRILALLPTEQALSSLLPQLKHNTHPELQMGAISALGDIPAPEAAAELVNHLPGFTAENQQLAITALTRTPERCLLLLKALENNSIPANILSLNDAHSLQQHPDENVRKAAVHVLAKDKN